MSHFQLVNIVCNKYFHGRLFPAEKSVPYSATTRPDADAQDKLNAMKAIQGLRSHCVKYPDTTTTRCRLFTGLGPDSVHAQTRPADQVVIEGTGMVASAVAGADQHVQDPSRRYTRPSRPTTWILQARNADGHPPQFLRSSMPTAEEGKAEDQASRAIMAEYILSACVTLKQYR